MAEHIPSPPALSLSGQTSAPRLRTWRPRMSLEMLLLLVALYFALTANGAFWTAVKELGMLQGMRGVRLYIGITAALVGLHALLFGLLLNRWIAKPVLAALLVITAATAYFASEYTVYMDPSMLRNALRTDTAEAAELLTPALGLSILLMGVLPAIALCLVQITPRHWKSSLLRRLLFLLGMFFITCLGVFATFHDVSSLMRNNKSLRYLMAPGNYLFSTLRVLTEDTQVDKGPRKPIATDARHNASPLPGKPQLLVIVVGETVRAQNWGLNGYARQTTPQLAGMDVINYSNVTACGTNTEVSVPCMFSLMGRRNYDRNAIVESESLLHVLERAGIKTLWRDNQTGCKGVCDGLAFESFRQPRINPLCDAQTCHDPILLEGLHEIIDGTPGDRVIVLHQLGNHGPSYFKRYPDELRKFTPDCRSSDLGKCSRAEIVNAYDNAILATDDFLARTIRLLEQNTTHDTALIYLSDHGESLGEGNIYLHGFPYAIAPDTQIKVPMLAWLSQGMVRNTQMDLACVQARAQNPNSHDNLFHSVLGLMRVSTQDYEPSLDLFSGCQRNTAPGPSRSP